MDFFKNFLKKSKPCENELGNFLQTDLPKDNDERIRAYAPDLKTKR